MLVAAWPTTDKGVRAAIRYVFRAINGVSHGTPALSRPVPPSRREGEADAAHKGPSSHSLAGFTRRAGELRSQCFWHLIFALSLRGRRRSARNVRPASTVEASHPQVLKIIALTYQRCIRACHSEESLRLDGVIPLSKQCMCYFEVIWFLYWHSLRPFAHSYPLE